jgi:hypothetical protein
MNRELMKSFLEATNGGLDIFKKYIDTSFELGKKIKSTENSRLEFMIVENATYGNCVMKVWRNGSKYANWNAIWFMKEYSDYSESEVYEVIDEEMNLGLLVVASESETTGDSGVVEATENDVDIAVMNPNKVKKELFA